jgi:NAD(P)-dependent dehydrogenase (short-subunit alcohol dehydrogenase family)
MQRHRNVYQAEEDGRPGDCHYRGFQRDWSGDGRGRRRKGAKAVFAARSEQTLSEITRRLAPSGDRVLAVPCDVTDRPQVDRLAQATVSRFGRIDTWVNNAGLGLYGRLDEVSDADSRRLFEIDFWGVVNGLLTALPHLKKEGGAMINVGSEVSEA